MKSLFMKTTALAFSAIVYSHAIFGIGGQWAPAPSLEVKASEGGTIASAGGKSVTLSQSKISGLQGLGIKLWVDAIPFIDIEASSNIQMGYYDVNIVAPKITGTGNDTLALKYDLGVPGVQGKPAFARIVSDVTVLYPFLKLPPLVSIVKVYAGAGISHVLATQVLDSNFAQQALKDAKLESSTSTTDISSALTKAIVDKGLKSGIGFHLELGAKAKIPVIPIAIYADAKYHFLSSMPKSADANAITYELGAALAF